jgi:hypothetical protein
MRRTLLLVLVVIFLLNLTIAGWALTLTDDPATMVPLSMLFTQWCKDREMSYWETFWTITLISVAKEVADQAGENDFNSGHIAQNLLGMTVSWFVFDF